jgi:hypothetical protein
LFVQDAAGKFVATDTAVFGAARMSEGVDAVFVDVNGDGWADLYVVSGGCERPDGDPTLRDHLYLNNGHGHFVESFDAIPELPVNKSCVAAADVNGDGFADVFIGGAAAARRYGLGTVASYLLMNDGHGHFRASTLFSEAGIVTSAAFADLNGDGLADLVVAGEWMPVRVFYNKQGVLREGLPAAPAGWWQTVAVTDINGDGRPDILAGNWGLNSKLVSGKDGPLRLYVKDLDGNGTIEQLMTYAIGGEEYPFLGKDQLELALPLLKRSHLRYDEVAGKTIQYLFGNQLDSCRVLTASTLASAGLLNDGHGGFVSRDLPAALQLAPVFAFVESGSRRWVAAGNFYGVQPYEGRYDAMNPTVFSYDTGFHCLGALTQTAGEWRDARWVVRPGRRALVLVRNDRSPLFFTP